MRSIRATTAAPRRGLDRRVERRHQTRTEGLIAGIDEAGRGPLAGPVLAAAVIWPPALDPAAISGLVVDDSKALTAARRSAAARLIRRYALAVGVGRVDARTIDRGDILSATFEAMRRALAATNCPVALALIDGPLLIPGLACRGEAVVGGDRRIFSIAAASIIAKVERDRIMDGYDRRYPGYGFGRHKGYGTREHLAALDRLGPSPIHRLSFAPLRTRLEAGE